ncbi:MAG: hypothetical protein WCL23_02335 [Candidatus Moraniibacteriota bacterium]
MKKDYCVIARTGMKRKTLSFSGAVHPAALVAMFALFLSGIGYVYALNCGAIQGYKERELETNIAELRKESKKLQLTLAEQQSLSRIEASAKESRMEQAENVKVIEGRSALAVLR